MALDSVAPLVLTLEGVFYASEGTLWVADETCGETRVDVKLEMFRDRACHVVVAHSPPDPPDPSRWGGGSCYYEPSGFCPAGHHDNPGWIYSLTNVGKWGEGKAEGLDVSRWELTVEGGEVVKPDFAILEGHRSQITLASLPDIEDLKMEMAQEFDLKNVAELTGRMSRLSQLLSQIQDLKNKL